MPIGFWSAATWMTGYALTLALVGVLIYKKRYRTVPWFTLLIAQDAVQTVVLFAVRHFAHARPYFYTYYSFEALDGLLRLMVTWEVARILIQQHLGLKLYDEIRSYWAAFLLMASLGYGFLTFSPIGDPTVSVALRIEALSTIGVGGLLLMILSLTFFFGVKVRVHAQAIVYGLSLYLIGKFVVQEMVMLLGLGVWVPGEAWLKPVYSASLLLWIVCLWRDEPERALSEQTYRMVRLGRAGIDPPKPKTKPKAAAEDAEGGLVFSLQEKDRRADG